MKKRLDQLLLDKGFFDSREKAKAAIMAGNVYVEQVKVDKAGTKIAEEATITIKGNTIPYVSRGGLKLEKAIKSMGFNVNGKIVLDVGASTGGFTDCALQHGALKVYAVDVGYGQLAWSLRQDERVISLERTNIRYLTKEELGGIEPDVATIDVAFISLTKVLPSVKELISKKGEVLALIKPQFEAGKDKVGKKGVVRDLAVHIEVIDNVIQLAKQLEFTVKSLEYSPITGPEGNIEYLLWLALAGEDDRNLFHIAQEQQVQDIVKKAFQLLT